MRDRLLGFFNKFTQAIGTAFIVAVLSGAVYLSLLLYSPGTFGQIFSRERIVSVASKEITENGKFVFTENESYWVNDSRLDLHWNSRNTYAQLREGRTYRVKTRGIRSGFYSINENIVEVLEELNH